MPLCSQFWSFHQGWGPLGSKRGGFVSVCAHSLGVGIWGHLCTKSARRRQPCHRVPDAQARGWDGAEKSCVLFGLVESQPTSLLFSPSGTCPPPASKPSNPRGRPIHLSLC